jgi:hypothetical protein
MEHDGKPRFPAALILIENIAVAGAVLGGFLVWQMPYRLSQTTHRIMTFVAVLNGWVLLAAVLLGIVALVAARWDLARKPTADKRTFRWALISLLVTVVWAVAWSLSASVHTVSVHP